MVDADHSDPERSIHVEIVGDLDGDELETLYRQLRRELEENGVEASLTHAPPAADAKSGLGIVTDVVVPLFTAVAPVFGSVLHVWLTQRRDRCTLRLTGPGGAALELPAVEIGELDEVLRRWKSAAGGDPTP